MSTKTYAVWIKDPLGNRDHDVFAEVQCSCVRLYPGSGSEPADYDITPLRFSLNDADLDPNLPRHRPVVRYVIENGR